jgi:hypothetical protein
MNRANIVDLSNLTDKSSIFEITDVPVTPAVFSANINQWATGASAEKTYLNKTTGDYSAGNMVGAPNSVLGSPRNSFTL